MRGSASRGFAEGASAESAGRSRNSTEQAAGLSDPDERQALYIQAETLLCETEAALIPLYHEVGNLP